ncbi:MAG: DUF4332 domain-containing protein [Oscillatoria sp. PMC 1051.18]|uniref:DUF4332 domain-containing protein n=1 Tax=Oscillatoria salina TaxID=331517 RepID=UPI0013B9AD47|nr:DUF4332 domain-containing protein [Oscillatoria salina]MBZ8179051.1 DUF4332 domain-containing protein [Oscillatoria salina IIICB1]MEC4895102.1 DUF4332 domain-containing protein [Oscillatoria sp. PMC 1050.18]MEC5031669.1 DUF4332 domain-containing protein [Oscillatoria sp. PMC 1051.18]NET88787.1 DUF4332 domain-containing protein [Kamptonema sp. SIO1D9]
MPHYIREIESIDASEADKLAAVGITTTEELFEKGTSKEGREELVKTTGIDKGKILKFVNIADLCRIKGVGGEYSELLQATGVDTVEELKRRSPDTLYDKMIAENDRQQRVKQPPSLSQVRNWVAQAQRLRTATTITTTQAAIVPQGFRSLPAYPNQTEWSIEWCD